MSLEGKTGVRRFKLNYSNYTYFYFSLTKNSINPTIKPQYAYCVRKKWTITQLVISVITKDFNKYFKIEVGNLNVFLFPPPTTSTNKTYTSLSKQSLFLLNGLLFPLRQTVKLFSGDSQYGLEILVREISLEYHKKKSENIWFKCMKMILRRTVL